MGWLKLRRAATRTAPAGWLSVSKEGAGPGPDGTLKLKLPDGRYAVHASPYDPTAMPLLLNTFFGWEIVAWMRIGAHVTEDPYAGVTGGGAGVSWNSSDLPDHGLVAAFPVEGWNPDSRHHPPLSPDEWADDSEAPTSCTPGHRLALNAEAQYRSTVTAVNNSEVMGFGAYVPIWPGHSEHVGFHLEQGTNVESTACTVELWVYWYDGSSFSHSPLPPERIATYTPGFRWGTFGGATFVPPGMQGFKVRVHSFIAEPLPITPAVREYGPFTDPITGDDYYVGSTAMGPVGHGDRAAWEQSVAVRNIHPEPGYEL